MKLVNALLNLKVGVLILFLLMHIRKTIGLK